MDPEIGKLIQLIQLHIAWKANLKTGRADPKIKERPLGFRHPSSLPRTNECAFRAGPSSRRKGAGGDIG